MKLTKVEISNYRNLDGIKLSLHPTINFLVGENNLGKSNLLLLLNTIFNWRSFYEADFADCTKPIEVTLQFALDDIEKGVFEDLFDPHNNNVITIKAVQESTNDNIQFIHKESENIIPPNTIRGINYIYYDSLRNPSTELTFDKNKGVGKCLNHMIRKYFEINKVKDIDFIEKNKIDSLLNFINDNLTKIKSFKDFSLLANLEENTENILARIVTLKDDKNLNLQDSGYGVQFLAVITLTIFEKLLSISKYKYERGIFEDKEGNKYVSLVLGLDEPEIHLHPYMQRSLIKYLMQIIENEDSEFLQLISDIFSINKFIGQIIICTHSPSVLLSSYKQVIRFYKGADKLIHTKNGNNIVLPPNIEKHLMKNMPYVKESFFSKCVILVEGDSELGAFPIYAKHIGIDLDDKGICVIQAGSADSIPPLMKLLDEFSISNIGFIDRDKYDENVDKYKGVRNLYHTSKRDFEEEIVFTCYEKGEINPLMEVVKNNDSKGQSRLINKEKVNGIINKYGLNISNVEVDLDFTENDMDILYALFLSWLNINKSIVLGRTLGESLPDNLIPQSFSDILTKAVEMAENVK